MCRNVNVRTDRGPPAEIAGAPSLCPCSVAEVRKGKAADELESYSQGLHREVQMRRRGMVMPEQMRTIDKSRVIRFMGKLNAEKMREIGTALEVSLSLHIPEEVEAP